MNYKETIDYLFNALPMYQRVGKAAYKADLSTSLLIDEYFDHPHRQFRSIHIAGTNGKGSVSHMLASVLQEAGYKTGLYTSPHLKDFRERIKINGELISQDFIADFVEKHKNVFEKHNASFFEMTVAMAFQYFAKQRVDIAIVEVGMGGRLDSTNIINPDLSVITNIGLDHTRFLGNSLDKIAEEKAGIIKENVPVIISETHTLTAPVFIEKAKSLSSELLFADKVYNVERANANDHYVSYNIKSDNIELKLGLLGNYQNKNISAVLLSINKLKSLGWKISDGDILDGLQKVVINTGLKGRWQILGRNPLTVCDIGHNAEGVSEIVKQIKEQTYRKLHIVWGMVDDKDVDAILRLLPKDAKYYFTKPDIPRAMSELKLAESAGLHKLKGEIIPNVKQAYTTAIASADKQDVVFIGGSTFVVSELDL